MLIYIILYKLATNLEWWSIYKSNTERVIYSNIQVKWIKSYFEKWIGMVTGSLPWWTFTKKWNAKKNK